MPVKKFLLLPYFFRSWSRKVLFFTGLLFYVQNVESLFGFRDSSTKVFLYKNQSVFKPVWAISHATSRPVLSGLYRIKALIGEIRRMSVSCVFTCQNPKYDFDKPLEFVQRCKVKLKTDCTYATRRVVYHS